MEIALLSGAYKNAGDYLIEDRCFHIIKNSIPEANINVYLRKDIEKYLSEINSADVAIFTGGPIYQSDISNNFSVDAAMQLKPKTAIIGGGSWLNTKCKTLTYEFDFSQNTYQLFKRIDSNGGLGCRDLFAYKLLKNNGFKSPIMTGCPAWYDLKYVDCTKMINSDKTIRKICVSDPADMSNRRLFIELIRFLHERYPKAEIHAVFHRGLDRVFKTEIINMCPYININEITKSLNGFSIYDKCDLHAGFRVHAHIYNLSERQRTVLIEEDSRGAGVNEALGITSITAYNDEYVTNNRFINKYGAIKKGRKNRYFIKELESYLDQLVILDDLPLENAYAIMKKYYVSMQEYVKRICT